jgi:hypothetical protein
VIIPDGEVNVTVNNDTGEGGSLTDVGIGLALTQENLFFRIFRSQFLSDQFTCESFTQPVCALTFPTFYDKCKDLKFGGMSMDGELQLPLSLDNGECRFNI